MLCCWLGMGMGVPPWEGFPGLSSRKLTQEAGRG